MIAVGVASGTSCSTLVECRRSNKRNASQSLKSVKNAEKESGLLTKNVASSMIVMTWTTDSEHEESKGQTFD